jgi:hypothetical protein
MCRCARVMNKRAWNLLLACWRSDANAVVQRWSRGRRAWRNTPVGLMRGMLRYLPVLWGLAFGAAGVAQVQSYTTVVTPGFNAIANHFNNGRNTLNEVLPNVPGGTLLYKWDPVRQTYTEPARYFATTGWQVPEPLVGTLSPGEGAFLRVGVQTLLTFRGTPQQTQLRSDVVSGYNFVSCQTTQLCSFEEVFKFAPIPGDVVYKFDRAVAQLSSDPAQIATSTHRFAATGWDTVPVFERGRSAFVYLAKTPRIVQQPADETALAGNTVRLSVEAVGAPPLKYQWHFHGDPLPNETSNTLVFQQVALSNAGPYSVAVLTAFGSVTSRVARLQVLSPPRILEPPRPQTRVIGEPAVFKVVAEGTPPLSYQWLFDGTRLVRETNAMLMIPSVSMNHQGKYWVEIRNALGTVTSTSVALTVLTPPFIITQPKSQDARINDTVTFIAEAGGTQPLSYQWLRNGVLIPGETKNTLTIEGVQPQDGGSYRVVVANAAGAVQSEIALLRVDGPFRFLSDKFGDAEIFKEPAALFRSSNREASIEPGEPLHADKPGGKSVWFAWKPDESGIVTFRTRGSHFDTLLAAYTGEKVDALSEIASDEDAGGFLNSQISFNADRETIYYIAIDGYNGAEGEILVEWLLEPTTERLPVIIEQPFDHIVKLGADVSFSVRTEPSDVSFQWFFNGEAVGSGPVLTLRSVRPETAGTYYVRILYGRRAILSRMASLQFSMVGPDNEVLSLLARDKFGDIVERREQFAGLVPPDMAMAAASPPVVHGYTGTHLFSTVGAIKEEGEPDHCGVPGGASYWFSYAPPASGQLFLNTDGSSFDTVLAVYTATGPTYADLVSVACDNNSGANGLTSSLNFPAAAGVNYYIVVDGVGATTGTVRLNYKLLVPLVISNAAATNSFRFRVTATPALPFIIQRSANLGPWTSVLTTNSASGIYDYLDTNSAVRRFYRVMQVP